MKKIPLLPCNLILAICFILFSSCKKDKEDDLEKTSKLPAGIEFSMAVDGKEWQPQSVSYLSFLVESESMGDNYSINVGAYSTKDGSEMGEGDDPNLESIHFSFAIPASKIKNAVGTYEIGETVESETLTSYNGLVHYIGKNNIKYMPDYDIDPKSGTITVTKAEFGDQGTIGDFPLGEGLKSIEGTFEFGLYLKDDPSKKNLKITKGKFKLKIGEW